MEIYADVIFVVNFVMDSLILWIVAKIDRNKIKTIRIVIAGLANALLFTVMLAFPTAQERFGVFITAVLICIGVAIAFAPVDLKKYVQLVLVTYVVAFSIGGIGVWIFYFTNAGSFFGNMLEFTIHNFPLKLLLFTSATAYVLIRISSVWIKKAVLKKQVFCDVKVFFNERNVSLYGLVDTGNTLKEPISNTPVIVTELNKIKSLLPNEFYAIYIECFEKDLLSVLESTKDTVLAGRLRLLPFKSLGMENGMLIGFKPDAVDIINDGKKFQITNVIIGIYNTKLSPENTYDTLINPLILE